MLGKPTESFQTVADRIEQRHGNQIYIQGDDRATLIMDLVESWEDIQRFHPVFQKLAAGEIPDDAFRDALNSIAAWSGHLSDHLASLHKLLEVEFDAFLDARQD